MNTAKLFYVVNARMPSQKAYGIQIAKMCEAFIEQGIELELIIPRTRQSHHNLKEFYNLRVDVPTRVLPSLDWYGGGSIGFAISSVIFMSSACFYLMRHRQPASVYTIDMDPYSYSPLALLGMPITVEMHSPKLPTAANRFFFKRVSRIITTNPLIKDKLMNVFALGEGRFIVEPNGVDTRAFGAPSKEEARNKLGLPQNAKIALYVGRFYDWKGIGVLQEAAKQVEKQGILVYLVGGTKQEFEAASKGPSSPLYFAGSVPHNDIAIWCSAADALLILGTKANEFSYRYTAPMKLFEYLASGRTVIAADTPALRSLVSGQEVEFYIPDDSADLARKISAAVSRPASANGLQKAREHTWALRAERIREFIQYPSIPKT